MVFFSEVRFGGVFLLTDALAAERFGGAVQTTGALDDHPAGNVGDLVAETEGLAPRICDGHAGHDRVKFFARTAVPLTWWIRRACLDQGVWCRPSPPA
jgi:hypothetical protein